MTDSSYNKSQDSEQKEFYSNLNSKPESVQNEYIDNNMLYVNYTANYVQDRRSFIHNSFELLVILEGEAEYTIGGKKYTVKEGDILPIGAMDVHSSSIVRLPYVRYGLYINPRLINRMPEIVDSISVFKTPSKEDFEKLSSVSERARARIKNIFYSLHWEQSRPRSDSNKMIRALLCELTCLLTRALAFDEDSTTKIPEHIRAVKDYVDENYYQDLSLEKMGSKFFMQPNSVSQSFKKYYGITFNKYVNRVRVSEAIRIMGTKDASIAYLSDVVGYENVNTFIRQFKAVMNTTPLQYKMDKEKNVNLDFESKREL